MVGYIINIIPVYYQILKKLNLWADQKLITLQKVSIIINISYLLYLANISQSKEDIEKLGLFIEGSIVQN